MNVWLTGGAMRDMLRGAPIRDLDFTVERDAVKIGKSLAAAAGRTRCFRRQPEALGRTGAAGRHARLRFQRAHRKIFQAGRKPQIAPATIHEDLLRRDFTINAMALSLNRGSRGLLIDPANGQADLLNKELRATNPYIFFDDPSRIFRLIRFEHTLGFQLAPRLQSQLENAMIEGYQELAQITGIWLRKSARWPAMPMPSPLSKPSTGSVCSRPISPALTGREAECGRPCPSGKAAALRAAAGNARVAGWHFSAC